MSDPPCTIDCDKLKLNSDGTFSLTFTTDSNDTSLNKIVYPKSWKKGFIAMRNYVIPPGSKIKTPQLSSSTNDIIRPHHILVAGPTALLGKDYIPQGRVILLNCFAYVVTYILGHPNKISIYLISFGLLIGYLLYRCLFLIGKKGISKLFATLTQQTNVFAFGDMKTASKVSQPSQEHRYWMMKYDTMASSSSSSKCDVVICSTIDTQLQKYWSVVVYDIYGIPLPNYVYDGNVLGNSQYSSDHATSMLDPSISRPTKYNIRIRLTPSSSGSFVKGERDASGSDRSNVKNGSKNSAGEGVLQSALTCYNVDIDVSSSPVGYVLFRLVHPFSDAAEKYSCPSTLVTPHNHNDIFQADSTDSKKIKQM